MPLVLEYAVKPPIPEALLLLCMSDACAGGIVDFGEAFSYTGRGATIRLHTPVWFSAYKVIFLDPIDQSPDIWALSCLMYMVVGGR